MPITRFWGYYDHAIASSKSSAELIEEEKLKELKDADWDKEVKDLKRKLKDG